MKKLVLLLTISFIVFPLISLSQLVSGDLAFIGYNTDGTDNFSFITLNSVPSSQVIYLTEEGWDNATGTWVGTTEGHITYTAPAAGLPCGTVVSINETGTSTFTVSGGGTAVLGSGTGWSLSGGDQVLAYLAATPEPASTPTFIAGVHGDDGNGAPITLDPATGWNDSDLLSPLGTARSEVPPGLTNGTDCVSLFPTVGTEQDNAKYTGTLTGTSTAIRASINDRTNWSSNNSTPFAIQPADYSPSVTCVAPCSDPIMFAVSAAPTNVCDGENSTLTIQGVLNDATHWAVYTGSCGGTLLGTTATPSFVVTPGLPSTTYFVRGEGGCVTPGTCMSTTVNVTPIDDPSFTYPSASFCQNSSDPTPTITGDPGGTFSSAPAGLSINSSTGEIDVSASTPNSYTVTYTTAGACPESSDVAVLINATDDASFAFSTTTFCQNGTDPTPTITGLAGGTFSSAPAGLSMNTSTGEIDLSASTPNNYTITYTTAGTCPNSSNVSITINPLDDASFAFSTTTFCQSGADPTPSITGLAGGTFSSAPAGLSMNASTGEIDLSASTANNYTVTYTTAGPCVNSSNVSISINPLDDASFAFSTTTFCQNGTDPTPSITGLAGGTFTSAPAGLSMNASTGEIDLSTSTPNNYTVTYTTAGSCPNSSDVSITINALDDASFAFSTTTFCQSGADPTPTITGLAGGTFTSAPAGLSMNASTGEVDLSASTANNYTVTYATAGSCPNSSDVSITINALDDASFAFSTTTFCQNGTDPTPSITGLAGGTFSSTPAGLSMNASTGEIDLSASTPNNYTVTYTTAGSCPNSSNVSITINPLDDASFAFSTTTFCQNGTDPTPSITGLAGGTFSSAPAGLSMNTSTGEIDLSASTANNYTITYTTAGSCPNSSDVSITINALDDASFNYSPSSFCQIGSDQNPVITGETGGAFSSSPAGLSINPSTGYIDVSASTPNSYTVTYTTSGSCPNSSSFTVSVTPLDDATFSYSASTYCENDVDPTPTITGITGGSFSSSPSGLIIDSSTGEIDLSLSSVGTYSITYSTSGPCGNSSNNSITINATDDATFAFSTTTFCENGLVDPIPSITGVTGGTFTSAPSGLTINSTTGEVDLSLSTPNTYTITYTTSGACSNSSDVSITINPSDDASFTYASSTICMNESDPTPTVTGLPGGSFTAVPSGVDINPSTGEIDLSNSTAGSYTVKYSTSGPCPGVGSFVITLIDVDVNVIQSFDTLNATSTGSSYQWLDCDNGYAPIPGANDQQFIATTNGTYAVEISDLGCVDTSECFIVDNLSITENETMISRVYPNPTSGKINIEFANKINEGTITIRNITGLIIVEETIQGINAHSLSLNEPSGIYFIEVSLEKGHKEVFKFILK